MGVWAQCCLRRWLAEKEWIGATAVAELPQDKVCLTRPELSVVMQAVKHLRLYLFNHQISVVVWNYLGNKRNPFRWLYVNKENADCINNGWHFYSAFLSKLQTQSALQWSIHSCNGR